MVSIVNPEMSSTIRFYGGNAIYRPVGLCEHAIVAGGGGGDNTTY